MDQKTIKFDDTDIEEFYQYESFFSIKKQILMEQL